MEKFLEIYTKYKEYILFFVLFILFLGVQAFTFCYFYNDINNMKKSFNNQNIDKKDRDIDKDNDISQVVVDIKGEVKRPGVYFLDEGKRVIDVVKKAGGFTIDADSYVNNLSKKITDEMVIIIYSKEEIRDYQNIKEKEKVLEQKCKDDIIVNNSCVESFSDNDKNTDSNDNNVKIDEKASSGVEEKLISLNDASKELLMTLSGIGESKADAIIEYRKKKRFESVEEIKEVSGIGDALFEKIKDNITT